MDEQFLPSPRLLAALAAIGIELDERQRHQIAVHVQELLDWNRRMNLTAITDPDEIEIKHVLDSLVAVPLIRRRRRGTRDRLVDVGTGAGFPGLPLAVALPDVDVTLIEATGKKVAFLHHVIARMAITNVRAVHGRAEDLGHETGMRAAADFAVARAVGRTATLCELLMPLLAVGGWALLWKTRAGAEREIAEAGPALAILGGQVEEVADLSVPGLLEGRVCVVIRKVAPTPDAYPRRPGIPQRRPLGGRSVLPG